MIRDYSYYFFFLLFIFLISNLLPWTNPYPEHAAYKPFENYIAKDGEGKYEVNGSPYKQIALTQYNVKEEKRVYDKKIPKTRLDERHYNKIRC